MFIVTRTHGPLTPSGVKCSHYLSRHMELLTEFRRAHMRVSKLQRQTEACRTSTPLSVACAFAFVIA
jgi:hypothetical protein